MRQGHTSFGGMSDEQIKDHFDNLRMNDQSHEMLHARKIKNFDIL